MSLRRFLNVAYTLLVEEYQRMGVDLMSALEKLSEWREGASEEASEGAPSQSRPKQSARQNAQSISQLQGMLAGVHGAPKGKVR